jgi:hypothetical protein
MYSQQQREIAAAIEQVTATGREANQQVKAFDELAAESKFLPSSIFLLF